MVADVAASPCGVEHVDVEPAAVDVVHEELVAVLLGPGAAEVDHRAAVGVAAAGRVGLRRLPSFRLVADVVAVVGDRLDVVVGVAG